MERPAVNVGSAILWGTGMNEKETEGCAPSIHFSCLLTCVQHDQLSPAPSAMPFLPSWVTPMKFKPKPFLLWSRVCDSDEKNN